MKRQNATAIIIFVSVGLLFGWLGYSVERWNSHRASSVGLVVLSESHAFPELVIVETDGGSNGNELHKVAIAKYEVTRGDWERCAADGACQHLPIRYSYTESDHPVSEVSWLDAQQYLNWLSNQTGHQFRLPKASEWRSISAEYSQTEAKKFFDDPRMEWANQYAYFSNRPNKATKPVGHFGTASTGIADLDGNVWEWTETCATNLSENDSRETTDQCRGIRVLAGSHMTNQPEIVRYVPIGGCSIGFAPPNIGFRVVLDEPLDSEIIGRISNSPRIKSG